ncbi:hypothetical protein AGLY_014993 [Aphis glycines]|uniref:Uncharacterized protein n=1 Tax=Aphis glycines TaxID=307491 RepID=A0A6G0T2T0_APHGL|nr:hypothetical protein AGLY_014993 [Aphis glycines]
MYSMHMVDKYEIPKRYGEMYWHNNRILITRNCDVIEFTLRKSEKSCREADPRPLSPSDPVFSDSVTMQTKASAECFKMKTVLNYTNHRMCLEKQESQQLNGNALQNVSEIQCLRMCANPRNDQNGASVMREGNLIKNFRYLSHTSRISFHAGSESYFTIFKYIYPDHAQPPEPIITRWGTWLVLAQYYCEHFLKIQEIISKLHPKTSMAIGIKKIKSMYLNDGMQIVKSAIEKLKPVGGQMEGVVQKKLHAISEKILSYIDFKTINKIMIDRQTPF